MNDRAVQSGNIRGQDESNTNIRVYCGGIFLFIIACVGIAGNMMAICVIATKKKTKKLLQVIVCYFFFHFETLILQSNDPPVYLCNSPRAIWDCVFFESTSNVFPKST